MYAHCEEKMKESGEKKDKLASRRKIQANRANAQKSTGPRTREGKKRVSRNAIKHGLFAQETLLLDEDPEELIVLARQLRNALAPIDAIEGLFVDLLVRDVWRLRRVSRLEVAVVSAEQAAILREDAERQLAD